MKKVTLSICFCFTIIIASCQNIKDTSKFNFDFEILDQNIPAGWNNFGSPDYKLSVDKDVKESGKFSASIEYQGSSPNFKAWAYTIPENYEGKKITLSGYMKTENVTDGWAGLWLRIDPNIGFDNMQQRGIKGTTDWKKYEITLDLNPAKTKQIVFGGLLAGKGKMWIDDFHVTIDGKDINTLKPIAKKEYAAEKDKEFDEDSKIASITLTESKIDDLTVLGKVWGFLKYYHPAVAKGDYNWDYELFRVLPKILAAKNKTERNDVLSAWVDGFGKVESGKEKKNKEPVKINPDLIWINNSELGDKLNAQLTDIKNAKRTDENYYIAVAEGVGNALFDNEHLYSKMKYPDAGFRLLCLYRYWNIIQYYYPYKNLFEENWNDILKEYIPKFNNAGNELDYQLATLSIIARVHDTHANIWGRNETLENYRGLKYAPVEITFVENKAVVTDYYDTISGVKTGLKIGNVIESINNKSVEDIVKERLPLTPASNYPTQLRDIAPNLLRTNDTVLNVGYTDGVMHFNTKIKCVAASKVNLYKKFYKKDTCFKLINKDIAYIYPGSIKNEYLPKIMPEVLKKKGLIIDLRCYPSEFVVFTLSKYLLPEKTSFVKFSYGSILSPGLFLMTDELKVGEKNKDYFKGKVVILVNETTQSQAEYTTMALRTAPKATVIGSTTAGADGNVSQIYLPGNISTMISGIGIYYPDGKETQRVGIIPNIVSSPTIKGIKEGKDELLEQAIEIINSN